MCERMIYQGYAVKRELKRQPYFLPPQEKKGLDAAQFMYQQLNRCLKPPIINTTTELRRWIKMKYVVGKMPQIGKQFDYGNCAGHLLVNDDFGPNIPRYLFAFIKTDPRTFDPEGIMPALKRSNDGMVEFIVYAARVERGEIVWKDFNLLPDSTVEATNEFISTTVSPEHGGIMVSQVNKRSRPKITTTLMGFGDSGYGLCAMDTTRGAQDSCLVGKVIVNILPENQQGEQLYVIERRGIMTLSTPDIYQAVYGITNGKPVNRLWRENSN
ncbi:hypothetical protein CO049_03680, partial [Candidatus Roizmanbacteria bacterium CG_4_9_14_0_2_um_filter_36_12]